MTDIPTDGTIGYTGSIDTYTVASTGTYDIIAYGAEGGSAQGGHSGGDGAEIGGDFSLTEGEVLKILVGGQGTSASPDSGGGGGGTFVLASNGSGGYTPLVIAGGGGGSGSLGSMGNGGSGGTTASGGGGGGGGGDGGGGGVSGNGGGGGEGYHGGGGGGGGYLTRGATGTAYYGGGSGSGGSSFANGGSGGGATPGGAGGFGGGGGGGGYGGGGGGGYSGGGGGGPNGGGGGGSLDNGTSQTLVAGENGGNGFVFFDLLCFLEGTLIATPDGERPVESLTIGSMVTLADGGSASIRWIGRRTLHAHGAGGYRFADPLVYMPIRIKAGALGDNLPVRDLLVSADHAVLVDGLLVQAGALVNGTSVVRQTRLPERFTFYHIELADHALVLAEGVPAETFVDNVDRMGFDNWAEHEALYGNEPAIAEMPYPRVQSLRQLPLGVRRLMRDRARALAAAATTEGVAA
jgi:hypothetical protein